MHPLIYSDAARRGALEEHRAVKLSTYGIGKLIVNVASVFVKADDRLLQHLERHSEWLQQQLGQYGPISGDFDSAEAFAGGQSISYAWLIQNSS